MGTGVIAVRQFITLIPVVVWSIGAEAAPGNTGAWQPTEPFKILPATDRCVVASAFKRGDQVLQVTLEGNPTTDEYLMRIYAPGDFVHSRSWLQGKYSLGRAKLAQDWVVARHSNRAGRLIYSMKVNEAELAVAGAAPDLAIRKVPNPGDLRITGLEAVKPLMDTCSADLLERWGYSKEFQRNMAGPPTPLKELAKYVSRFDYPTSALMARKEGETHVIIDIGLDGRSSNCRVIRSSGTSELDKTTCKILTERVQFNPAKTTTGIPVVAPLYVAFGWESPRR